MLTTLFLLLFAQRQRAVAPAVDWKIEITTDGGFTGNGNGGLTVSSDGTLVITLVSRKQCTFHLAPGELQTLNAAVLSARPATWLECYSFADVTTHCCDLVKTTLKLSERNDRDVFVTSWLVGAPFPTDLQNVIDLLRGPAGLDARYRPLCTP